MKGHGKKRRPESPKSVAKSSPSRSAALTERRAEPPQRPPVPVDSLGLLGVEIWRLGSRARRLASDPALDSYERLLTCFQQLGGRIEDRTGQRFVDGQIAEILHQPPGSDPGSELLIIRETVRPAVFLGDDCIVTPQVVLDGEQTES